MRTTFNSTFLFSLLFFPSLFFLTHTTPNRILYLCSAHFVLVPSKPLLRVPNNFNTEFNWLLQYWNKRLNAKNLATKHFHHPLCVYIFFFSISLRHGNTYMQFQFTFRSFRSRSRRRLFIENVIYRAFKCVCRYLCETQLSFLQLIRSHNIHTLCLFCIHTEYEWRLITLQKKSGKERREAGE